MATARGHHDGASTAARVCAAGLKRTKEVHKNLRERFIRSATSEHAQKHVGATLPFLTKVNGDDAWEQHNWSLTEDVAVDRWPISCSLADLSAGELIAADEALKPDQCPFPAQQNKHKCPKGLKVMGGEGFSVKLKKILKEAAGLVDECTRRGGGTGHKEGKCACARCAAAARSLQHVGASVMLCQLHVYRTRWWGGTTPHSRRWCMSFLVLSSPCTPVMMASWICYACRRSWPAAMPGSQRAHAA